MGELEFNSVSESKVVEIKKSLIISQAKQLGWEEKQFEDDDDLVENLVDFFHENLDKLTRVYKDECEIHQSGHQQSVNYGEYQSWGEITDWSQSGWFCHSDFVDFDEKGAYLIKLYDFKPTDKYGDEIEKKELKTGFVNK